MNEYRLRHRADVTRKASTSLNTDGERVLTDSMVYTDVPCLIQSRTATPIEVEQYSACLLYTSPSPRDRQKSRMPSSA